MMTTRPTLVVRALRRIATQPGRLFVHHWLRPRGSYVVSYPKAGRTWLALMLASLLSDLTGRPLTLRLHTYADDAGGIPRIFFTHDGAGLTRPRPLGGRKEFYRGKAVLLLVRDPRDIVVSHYFQVSRRKRRGPTVTDLDSFIRGRFGINRVIEFMNGWAAQQSVPGRFAIVRYEEMHEDCRGVLRRCVDFFGIQGVPDQALSKAVENGSFERMRAMEAASALDDRRLQPRNPADPNSYKVRRGRVEGYLEDLAPEQIEFLDERIRQSLSPMFSYYIR